MGINKLLAIGGSGRVGAGVLPHMTDAYDITVYDLNPPPFDGVDSIQGDVTDADALRDAVAGMDAIIYMVMPALASYDDIGLNHDVSLKGLHMTLVAAQEAGIHRMVYLSSGSVLWEHPFPHHDDLPHKPDGVYALAKALGERVCEWFCQHHDMSIFALRLWWPMDQKRHEHPPPHFDDPLWKICGTRTDDTARAIQLALESTAKGYYALLISGDTTGEYIRTDRARNLLGWTPTPWDGP